MTFDHAGQRLLIHIIAAADICADRCVILLQNLVDLLNIIADRSWRHRKTPGKFRAKYMFFMLHQQYDDLQLPSVQFHLISFPISDSEKRSALQIVMTS